STGESDRDGVFPSLHHSKEGWRRPSKIIAKPPTPPGWLSTRRSENHPVLAFKGCCAAFIDRSATPPCGDARRGIRHHHRHGNCDRPVGPPVSSTLWDTIRL